MYDKEAEFRTWLVEERKINPEVITKDQTKKEFARFTEDFNTGEYSFLLYAFDHSFYLTLLILNGPFDSPPATLPHEKYYNMYNYEQRMSSMRNGEVLTIADDGYDPNADLLAHTSAHKKPSTSKETYMSTEQLQELRRVQAERSQVGKMKLMGMDVGQTFGVRMDGSVFDG
ncbi:hypothetical protein DFH11DRAFT_1803866 [Phellopilus nigrolimitatus]|nr:hypothetical protein DFH11DRAFT_1803866 [Phellopilus nigrolimitatus]